MESAKTWLREAKEKGATHVISVCDTFSWEDYPVFVMPGEKLETVRAEYDGLNMQKINDVLEVDSERD